MILLLVTTLLVLVWRSVKVRQQPFQHQSVQPSDYRLYADLGQSIAALHIQLQVAQKLWNIDPAQAQSSLSEAAQLSATLMQEVRRTVKQLSPASRGLSHDAPENSITAR